MKKFLSFILAVSATASVPLSAVSAQSDDSAGDFGLTYETIGGNAFITGFSGSDAVVIIPSEIDGKKVTGISGNAFIGDEDITVVVIPDSVTSIGDKAFSACPSLTTVTIGSGVNEIGSMAFSACPTLQSFFVSSENKTYTSRDGILFEGTELVSYAGGNDAVIPDGTVSVRRGAFTGKTEIYSVIFPDKGLLSLGDYSFSGCTSLEQVNIPDTVTYTGAGCFAGCYNLEEVFLSRTCTSVSERSFFGCTSLRSIAVPSSVTDIEDSAFLGCEKISGIYIPPTVKTIGADAVGRSYNVRENSIKTVNGFTIHADKDSAGAEYAESLDIPVKNLMPGDTNGNGIIEGSDATMTLTAYTYLSAGRCSGLDAYQRAASDWNGDDIITGSDATAILMKYTRLSSGYTD